MAFIAGLVYLGYSMGASNTHKKLDPKIAALNLKVKDLTDAVNERDGVIDAARQTSNNQAKAYKDARTQQDLDHKAVLAAVTKKLNTAVANETRLKEKYDASIKNYVTPTADANCTVPVGFIRLYNESSQVPGTADPTSPSNPPRVPSSGFEDASAPSGIALSTIAGAVAFNNTEAIARGDLLEAWRSWYAGAFQAWQKAVAIQGSYQIKLPPAPAH